MKLTIQQFTGLLDRALRACHEQVAEQCPDVQDVGLHTGKELKEIKDQLPRAFRKIVKSDMAYITARVKLTAGEDEKEVEKKAIEEAEKYFKILMEETLGMTSSEGGVKGELIPNDPDKDDEDADRAKAEEVRFFVVEVKL